MSGCCCTGNEFSWVLPCILMWGGVQNLHGNQKLQISKSLLGDGIVTLLAWLSDGLKYTQSMEAWGQSSPPKEKSEKEIKMSTVYIHTPHSHTHARTHTRACTQAHTHTFFSTSAWNLARHGLIPYGACLACWRPYLWFPTWQERRKSMYRI